jgi:MFS family permease
VWIWHGLVPKLLSQAIDERRMLAEAGLPMAVLPWFGWAEIVLGIAMLAGWRWRWLFGVNIVLMVAALVGVAVRSPEYLTAAFNPVTLNICMIALAVVGWAVAKRMPTAARCLRNKPKEDA